ncbi:MAG: hypothetical protein MZW92_24680 [Comamonadaceae bacterium]|nr:hypothetical protein [Comamonadaceae bacterium]
MASRRTPLAALKTAFDAVFRHDTGDPPLGARAAGRAADPAAPTPRRRPRPRPISSACAWSEELAGARADLTRLLDEDTASRAALRHLAAVEHALGRIGWQAFERLPLDVLQRAHSAARGPGDELVGAWRWPGCVRGWPSRSPRARRRRPPHPRRSAARAVTTRRRWPRRRRSTRRAAVRRRLRPPQRHARRPRRNSTMPTARCSRPTPRSASAPVPPTRPRRAGAERLQRRCVCAPDRR